MLTSSIKSLDLTSYKIVKELLKNTKPSGAMTQWFLVMAKSTFNEESKPLVIDNSWCALVLSEKVVTGRKRNTIASTLPMILNEGISRKSSHIRYLSGHTVVHKHTQWDMVVHRHGCLNINNVTQKYKCEGLS